MEKNDGIVRLFSALEVANICGFKNQTAINWIKKGDIKAFTTPGGQYRVYPEDLIEFMSSRNMRIPRELLELAEGNKALRKVLIVDDDEQLNSLIKQFLIKKFPDFSITQAFDGFEAGKLVFEVKPGLIILDIDLPGINGHELCKKIKGDPNLGSPRILTITGLADPDMEERVLAEGADAFMPKPLNFDELPQVISDLLKGSKKRQ